MAGWVGRVFQVVALMVCLSGVAWAAKPLDPAMVRQIVEDRGVGKDLKVVLGDGSTVSGEIVWIGEERFQLKVKTEAEPTDLSFSQVTRVGGSGLSKGVKVGIVVGLAAVVVILAVALR